MGRSRGGLITKIQALVDAEGRPINLRLSTGQIADCKEAEPLLEVLGESDIVLADKGYDTNAIGVTIAQRKAWPTSRRKPQQGHLLTCLQLPQLPGSDEQETTCGSTKRRMSQGQAMRSIFGRARVTQTDRTCSSRGGTCSVGIVGNPAADQASYPPSSASAATS